MCDQEGALLARLDELASLEEQSGVLKPQPPRRLRDVVDRRLYAHQKKARRRRRVSSKRGDWVVVAENGRVEIFPAI